MIFKPALKGIIGAVLLLTLYFLAVTLVSGWDFALNQFSNFWYFIISLAVGFGIQIGLYSYLKSAVSAKTATGRVVAVSGTASTVAMVSCCSHYLANILPLISVAGAISLLGQYQVQLFWVGLFSNLAGIIYITSKIIKFSKK